MGVTVLAMDLIHDGSSHKMAPMGPNFCITPGAAAGAPAPLPYPITQPTVKTSSGTSKTKEGGNKTLNAKAKVKACTGDQPGSQKDVSSFTTAKKSMPFPIPAVTVHFEGMVACITGNPGMGNCM